MQAMAGSALRREVASLGLSHIDWLRKNLSSRLVSVSFDAISYGPRKTENVVVSFMNDDRLLSCSNIGFIGGIEFTAEDIKDAVMQSLAEVGVKAEQIVSVASDGGSESSSAVALIEELGLSNKLPIFRFVCFNHQLDSAIKYALDGDSLRSLFGPQGCVRALFVGLRTYKNSEAMAKLLSKLRPGSRIKFFPYFSDTRWMYAFIPVKYIVELMDDDVLGFVGAAISSVKTAEDQILEREQDFRSLLTAFREMFELSQRF